MSSWAGQGLPGTGLHSGGSVNLRGRLDVPAPALSAQCAWLFKDPPCGGRELGVREQNVGSLACPLRVFGLSSEGAAVVSLAPSSGRVENGLRGQGQREPGGGCLVGAAGPSRQVPWQKTRVAESVHLKVKTTGLRGGLDVGCEGGRSPDWGPEC